jgi:hypothetical protein
MVTTRTFRVQISRTNFMVRGDMRKMKRESVGARERESEHGSWKIDAWRRQQRIDFAQKGKLL